MYRKDAQYYKFCLYGFLKNLRFFEPFFILFLRYKGLSFTQIGILYAAREITTNLFEIPSGLMADAVGRKKSLMFSYILYITSYLIFAFGQGFWLFLFAIIFYGMADAFRSGTNKAMIYHYLEVKGWSDYKVDYYGHTRSCSQLGSAISSLVAAAIVFLTNDYTAIYLYTIVPYVLGFFLIASYPGWIDKGIKKKSRKASARQVWQEFWQTVTNLRALRYLTNLSLLEAYHKALKDYIQPLIKQMAVAVPLVWLASVSTTQRITVWIGIVYFVIYLLTAFASRRASLLIKRRDNLAFWVNTLLMAALVIGMLSGWFSHQGLPVWAVVMFMLIYIVHNLRKPISVAYLNNIFKTEVFASGVSTQNQIKTLLTAGISLILGWLADVMGVGMAIVVVSFILLIISLLLRVDKK